MTLLDNDLYAFTMSQVIWNSCSPDRESPGMQASSRRVTGTVEPSRVVRYELIDRGHSKLGKLLSVGLVQDYVDEWRKKRFKHSELAYLRSLGYFTDGYLAFLDGLSTWPEVFVENREGELVLQYEGPWESAVFLEVPLLAILSELRTETFGTGAGMLNQRLWEKLDWLSGATDIKFSDFGTRRRHSKNWHYHVLDQISTVVRTSCTGTSNVWLAQEFGLRPVGTMAHQMFMVLGAGARNEHELLGRERQAMGWWTWDYQKFPELMTLLPDTFGSWHLLDQMKTGELDQWLTIRQDSGDPNVFLPILNRLYKDHHIDPSEHHLVYSDSLNPRKMSTLLQRSRTGGPVPEISFGWGQNLTADSGIEPNKLVIKPTQVDGVKCVKLSDDFDKATGDPAEITRYAEMTSR